MGIRVTSKEEIEGLDIGEHGHYAYPDFVSVDNSLDTNDPEFSAYAAGSVPMEQAIPVVVSEEAAVSGAKITKVEIVTKQSRFEVLKEALDKVGITGMTVSNVLGYGIQGGRTEYYRGGLHRETNLLPKIKVEIVVSKVPVRTVIETAKQVLYTGNIGDGKIFISNIENVVKVRTGEEGYAALQDVE
jgi:Amt family ammonium transporter